MPRYQVSKFHAIAATSAAVMAWSGTDEPTMPLPTVFATSVPVNAPTKFSAAAMAIATPVRITRVETTVATALAVSWNPLMKSNANANRMRTASGTMPTLGMLDHEPTEHV